MGIVNLIAPLPALTRIGAMDAPSASDLLLDALVSEREGLRNKVTEYPVEDGSTVSDNIIPQPNTLLIEGAISNSPVYDVIDVIKAIDTGTAASLVGQNTRRAELAWQKLTALRDQRKLLRIVTPRQTFENYAIENVDRIKSATTGEILSFQLTLKQVRKVVLQFVTGLKPTRTGQGQPNIDKADQAGAEPPKPAQIKASILKKISDGVGLTKTGSGL